MTYGGDPFGQPSDDPFASPDFGVPSVPTSYSTPTPDLTGWQYGGQSPFGQTGPPPGPEPPLNTFAVLSPIFGVLVPPAGVALGHLALPQIKRTGERGWVAAVAGLTVGYLMSVVLLAGAIWFFGFHNGAAVAPTTTTVAAPSTRVLPRSTTVVTSVAPTPTRSRVKIDLQNATVGMCVEIQRRDDTGADALDLFEVQCEHRDGVYTVVARAASPSGCNSTYTAAPPDMSFGVCLNKY